jgi:hypothetical protein
VPSHPGADGWIDPEHADAALRRFQAACANVIESVGGTHCRNETRIDEVAVAQAGYAA